MPLLVLLAAVLLPEILFAQAKPEYVPGALYVKFETQSGHPRTLVAPNEPVDLPELENIVTEFGISRMEVPFKLPDDRLQSIYLVTFDTLAPIAELMERLGKIPGVEFVERPPIYRPTLTPNDLHPAQYSLPITQAEQAWDISTGSQDIVVAIVDDGVLLSHEDLQGVLWSNPNDIPGNGIDDDLNGYVDDNLGYDNILSDNDPNPPPTATDSYYSHGTHCAGIAGAQTDNGVGIASIGNGIRIMPVKVAYDNNPNAFWYPGLGVEYAIANHADVISMSWGCNCPSLVAQILFDIAHEHGIVCVAGAGNENNQLPFYPAILDHVISVGATNASDAKASFSTYGTWVDVMAPGKSIYSCTASGPSGYNFKSGTSMATPFVAGLAALILSRNPLMTPDQVETCIKNTCDNIDAQNPAYIGLMGSGRVNAFEALRCVPPITAAYTSDYTQVCPGFSVQFTDGSSNDPTSWQWSFPGGVPATSTAQNPLVNYPVAGVFDVTLIVINPEGTDTLHINNYITVSGPSASFSGVFTVPENVGFSVPVTLLGNPPFSLSWTDGTSTFSASGITYSPYPLVLEATDTSTFSFTAVSDAQCAGSGNGNVLVNTISIGTADCSNVGTWSRLYRAPFVDTPSDLLALPDGGFVLSGSTWSYGAGLLDQLLIRTNACGQQLWAKAYGTPMHEQGSYVIPRTGGFLFSGYANYPGFQQDTVRVLALTGSGSLLWTRRYDYVKNGHIIAPAANNGFAMLDVVQNVFKPLRLSLMDSLGVPLTSSRYEVGEQMRLRDFKETAHHGHVMVADALQNSPTFERWGAVIETDSLGNLIWAKRYSSPPFLYVNSCVPQENGFLFSAKWQDGQAGQFSSQAIVFKTDVQGNILWSRELQSDGCYLGAAEVLELDNHELMVRGDGRDTAFTMSFDFLARLDSVGNVLEADTGRYYWFFDAASDDHVFAAFYNDFGIGSNTDILVERVAVAPLSHCARDPFPMTSQPITIAEAPLPVNVSLNAFPTTLMSLTETIVPFTDTLLCQTLTNICSTVANFEVTAGCVNESIAFTDLSVDTLGNNIITWMWNFGDGSPMVVQQHPSHAFAAAGTYQVQLVSINDAQPACFDTAIVSVNIVSLPQVSVAADTTICVADSVALGLGNAQCMALPLSWQWTPTAGLSNPSNSNPMASPAGTTVYTVVVTDAAGATATASVTVGIDSTCCETQAAFNPTQPNFCEGESLMFVNTSTGGNAPIFDWTFGAGAVPAAWTGNTPPPIAVPAAGQYPVQLIVSDPLCGTDTATHTILVAANPLADAGLSRIACGSDTLHIGMDPISFIDYSWQPTVGLSDPNAANPVATISGPATYTLTAVNAHTGCTATATIDVNAFFLTVSGDTVLCSGEHAFLTATANLSGYSIAWNPTTGLDDPTSDTVTATLAASQRYEATADGPSGCTATANVEVTILPQPQAAITVDFLARCDEAQATLTSTGTGTDSLFWIIDNQQAGTGEKLELTLMYQTTVHAKLIAAIAGGCSDSASVTISPLLMEDYLWAHAPNVFSPNGDGINDFIELPITSDFVECTEVEIYNRWGVRIFSSQGVAHSWDGRTFDGQPAPAGVYFLIVHVGQQTFRSSVTLMR